MGIQLNKPFQKRLLLTIVFSITTVLIFGFILNAFCWKGFNYYFCAAPENVSCYVKEVNEYSAKIWLYQRSSAAIDRFGGYDYDIRNNVVYLGVNITYFWGERFQMPTEINIQSEEKIEKIILKGGGKEKVLYDVNNETAYI